MISKSCCKAPEKVKQENKKGAQSSAFFVTALIAYAYAASEPFIFFNATVSI